VAQRALQAIFDRKAKCGRADLRISGFSKWYKPTLAITSSLTTLTLDIIYFKPIRSTTAMFMLMSMIFFIIPVWAYSSFCGLCFVQQFGNSFLAAHRNHARV